MDTDKLLGDFLRARREATSPDSSGLIHVGRRRTPGLRREEVAMLAGVSTDYYVRLEQGRERRPSEPVLDSLARVLRLNADAKDYLYEIAYPRLRRPRPAARAERVSPSLMRLLGDWRHTPAFVLGRWMDMLAVNPVADVLYEGLEHRDNLLRLVFLNPRARQFYPDWEKTAHVKAAHLRAVAGADPDDPFLPELVRELSSGSEDFRRMWARHDVRAKTHEIKRIHHHHVGELLLTYESFSVNNAPGQQLIVFQAEPGSTSEYALGILGRLAAERTARAQGAGRDEGSPRSLPLHPAGQETPSPFMWNTRL
ncbi:helix-turn-helix transcriptional regulator [Sphaerisporangium sp. TRM90804]|uniref:helix-turn-helix transcriptional regulator n=1 Tax=Sphaerisporangium sp. TRM90804 TaxID=3031113 RepID=UPI00244AC9AF|nr:helix-turn-helix transcriptional regulator [Sphaerisporangium sp. TRM90804]MDH2427342.1 helix-turn-helix transcriptional regulator [Sphaerisporangium sp. TRM90804]